VECGGLPPLSVFLCLLSFSPQKESRWHGRLAHLPIPMSSPPPVIAKEAEGRLWQSRKPEHLLAKTERIPPGNTTMIKLFVSFVTKRLICEHLRNLRFKRA